MRSAGGCVTKTDKSEGSGRSGPARKPRRAPVFEFTDESDLLYAPFGKRNTKRPRTDEPKFASPRRTNYGRSHDKDKNNIDISAKYL